MIQMSLFSDERCDRSAHLYRKLDKQTSQVAAEDIQPKLVGLRAEFVRRLQELGRPATANEVAAGDESIRKRAAECVRLGIVREMGTKCCSVTRKRATIYWVND